MAYNKSGNRSGPGYDRQRQLEQMARNDDYENLGINRAAEQASSGEEMDPYYSVERKYFQYPGKVHAARQQRLGRQAVNANIDRWGPGVRNDMLDRIGGYESQAALLQQAAIDQARQQQLGMAGHAAASSRAAALRGAQQGAASSAQDIHLGARQARLQEEMGMLGALGSVRGQDLKDELQRQAWEMDKRRLQQQYEQMANQERQFGATLGAQGENLQGQMHSSWLGSRPKPTGFMDVFGPILGAAATVGGGLIGGPAGAAAGGAVAKFTSDGLMKPNWD